MSKRIAVIDSETDPFKRGRTCIEPFIWGFYDGVTYEEFADYSALPDKVLQAAKREGVRDTKEFIPFLEQQNIIVYAHNGGKFDYHFLLDYLEPFEPITVINGRLAKFKIGLCEFRDSINIMPVALNQWDKQVFDYARMEHGERYKPHNWRLIREYLQSDCLNLYAMVNAFIDRFGMHLTQAGAAMKLWESVSGQKAPRSDPDFYDDFKPFYYGGRTECFHAGKITRPFKLIDLNSAYPAAMLSEHPISLEYDFFNTLDIEAINGPDFYHIEGIAYGSLPYRNEDESLLFPNDNIRREYYITGWELSAALDTGAIDLDITLIEGYTFIDHTDFSDYILPLYNERKQAKKIGDKHTDLFNKLFMNGLYGKFAANPSGYSEYMIIDPAFIGIFDAIAAGDIKRGHDLADIEGYHFAGELGPWAVGARDLPEERQRYYNVATAASITGYVRATLWRAICRCDGVLYCDTDSIAAHDTSAISIDNELGGWSCDGEFQSGGIAGKKLYAFKYAKGREPAGKDKKKRQYKHASKGGRLTPGEILRICDGERIRYTPEAPTFSLFKPPAITSKLFINTAKVVPKLHNKK